MTSLSKAEFDYISAAQQGHKKHHDGEFAECERGCCPAAREMLVKVKVTQ